jgi:hypothetical protein
VSVSQYIRESALARAAAAAAVRGEEPLELLARLGGGASGKEKHPPEAPAVAARRNAADRSSDFAALAAQREQAFRHARAVTAQSEQIIRRMPGHRTGPPVRD